MVAVFLRPSIRQRLWIALALLAASTIFVGVFAWYSLDRANTRLETLHRQTLSEVARSLRLSRQSSDLATSAPFLLSLPSEFLIEREERLLAETLDQVAADWPSSTEGDQSTVYAFEAEIRSAIAEMKIAVAELAVTAEALNREKEAIQAHSERLASLESAFYAKSFEPGITERERRDWLALQAMANELVGAAHAGNLLGVGEHRRNYQSLARDFPQETANVLQLRQLWQMEELALKNGGLFESRRRELSRQLQAQNALFRIRSNASVINDLSGAFAANAESFLSKERDQTTTAIGFAKGVILVLGFGAVSIAIVSALFVSRYVTGNITAISNAMIRLAEGDRSSRLPKKLAANDEIGILQRSFRIFRANAARLDRTNKRLNQQNALFESVFLNISDGVAITDAEGRLTAANPNFANTLRLEPDAGTTGTPLAEMLKNSILNIDDIAERMGKEHTGYCEIRTADDTVIEIRLSTLPDGGGVWLFSDATERRQIQERLRQIHHIEGLGKVAGEVAHDFGNILSSIASSVHLIEQSVWDSKTSGYVERTRNALDIGASLVQRLLAFAKKQALSPEIVNLNELITGLTDLIGIGLRDGVRLEAQLSSETAFVLVDPGQLESAILNLCLNANQSIVGEGRITISVELRDTETAIVRIADTGEGMDNATLTRAFEPFFSARSNGDGTGLGLPMVYGFMKQSGGDIEITSSAGDGTEVTLLFPTARPVSKDTPISACEKHVLLVEDDPRAMCHAADCLEKEGYTVSGAATFDAARNYLEGTSTPNLLVTDLHLDNGETGWELAELCMRNHPSARVVIVSGRMPKDHPFQNEHEATVLCLEKPLTRQKLRAALQV